VKLGAPIALLILAFATISCAAGEKLVAVSAPDRTAEAEAVAGAFLRYVAQGGGIGCVRAEISRPAFGNDLEFAALRYRGERGTAPTSLEQLRSIVASQMSGWTNNSGQQLSPTEENALIDAAMEAAFSGPQPQDLTRASENWVPSSMRVDEGDGGCGVILGSPVIAGDIAFIDIGVVTIGRVHALRKIDGQWTVVASRVTWIS
jgi:hypothetical protein